VRSARSHRRNGRTRAPAFSAAEHQIHGDDDEPHHAGVARIDQAEQPLGTCGRESGKPFPARIDVDDSIERDDLGRTDQVGQVDEVAVQIGDATVVAAALALLARRVEVGSGGLDTGRAGSAGVEELVLDGADPASDIQERCAFDVLGL
jgi:hypothetical protein